MFRFFDESRYPLVVWGVIAQACTILITFPTWQIRQTPPNLPLWPEPILQTLGWVPPQFNFGVIILASLTLPLIGSTRGALGHVAVLLIVAAFDQFRLQPQFLLIALLMTCASSHRLADPGRWLLCALWFWAGLHKLLSVEWFGHLSQSLLDQVEWVPQGYHKAFAALVAAMEITLGILALTQSRITAVGAIVLHLGIVLFLSPLGISTNASVVPWNLYTALVALRLYWNSQPLLRRPIVHPCWAAGLFILPVGFYGGVVDRTLAFVLYSGMLPEGRITHREFSKSNKYTGFSSIVERIDGWGELKVPFPRGHRTIRQYFEKTASVGSKLHLHDPRPFLDDRFYVRTNAGIQPINVATFLTPQPHAPAGIPWDSRASITALDSVGCRMLRRTSDSAIYAVEFDPLRFRPETLRWLSGLIGVEQVQLANCAVGDTDLRPLLQLPILSGIGLSHTRVTDQALQTLSQLPNLMLIETEGTAVTAAGLNAIGFSDAGIRVLPARK